MPIQEYPTSEQVAQSPWERYMARAGRASGRGNAVRSKLAAVRSAATPPAAAQAAPVTTPAAIAAATPQPRPATQTSPASNALPYDEYAAQFFGNFDDPNYQGPMSREEYERIFPPAVAAAVPRVTLTETFGGLSNVESAAQFNAQQAAARAPVQQAVAAAVPRVTLAETFGGLSNAESAAQFNAQQAAARAPVQQAVAAAMPSTNDIIGVSTPAPRRSPDGTPILESEQFATGAKAPHQMTPSTSLGSVSSATPSTTPRRSADGTPILESEQFATGAKAPGIRY